MLVCLTWTSETAFNGCYFVFGFLPLLGSVKMKLIEIIVDSVCLLKNVVNERLMLLTFGAHPSPCYE